MFVVVIIALASLNGLLGAWTSCFSLTVARPRTAGAKDASVRADRHRRVFSPRAKGRLGSPTALAVAGVRGNARGDTSGPAMWTARVTQRAELAIGRPVRLAIDASAAYFFDVSGGDAIRRVEPVPEDGKAEARAEARKVSLS
jgi:hypothetical protein